MPGCLLGQVVLEVGGWRLGVGFWELELGSWAWELNATDSGQGGPRWVHHRANGRGSRAEALLQMTAGSAGDERRGGNDGQHVRYAKCCLRRLPDPSAVDRVLPRSPAYPGRQHDLR